MDQIDIILNHMRNLTTWQGFSLNDFAKIGTKNDHHKFYNLMVSIFIMLKRAKYIVRVKDPMQNRYYFTQAGIQADEQHKAQEQYDF